MRESQIMLKKAKELNYKSHVDRAKNKHVLRKPNPSSSPLICPPSRLTLCRAHSTPPRLLMSQGTSDSSSGGRGELPGQAGAGHSQTAERGGQCSAGAGQEHHQAAPAAAAATRGKEDHRVPSWQVAPAQILQDRSRRDFKTGMFPRLVCVVRY